MVNVRSVILYVLTAVEFVAGVSKLFVLEQEWHFRRTKCAFWTVSSLELACALATSVLIILGLKNGQLSGSVVYTVICIDILVTAYEVWDGSSLLHFAGDEIRRSALKRSKRRSFLILAVVLSGLVVPAIIMLVTSRDVDQRNSLDVVLVMWAPVSSVILALANQFLETDVGVYVFLVSFTSVIASVAASIRAGNGFLFSGAELLFSVSWPPFMSLLFTVTAVRTARNMLDFREANTKKGYEDENTTKLVPVPWLAKREGEADAWAWCDGPIDSGTPRARAVTTIFQGHEHFCDELRRLSALSDRSRGIWSNIVDKLGVEEVGKIRLIKGRGPSGTLVATEKTIEDTLDVLDAAEKKWKQYYPPLTGREGARRSQVLFADRRSQLETLRDELKYLDLRRQHEMEEASKLPADSSATPRTRTEKESRNSEETSKA